MTEISSATAPAASFGQAFHEASAAATGSAGNPSATVQPAMPIAPESGTTPGEPAVTTAATPKADEPGPQPAGLEPDYKALYARELQRRRSLEGRFRKERARWQSSGHGPGQTNAERTAGSFPHAGESYREDASDLAAAPEMDTHYADADAASAASSPAASVGSGASPVSAASAAAAVDRHVTAISAAHPDWRDLAQGPELAAWIDTAPHYLAEGYRRTAESGNAHEVIDLLSRFKAERQAAAPHTGNTMIAPRRNRTVEFATAVPSRPAGPPQGRPDRQDFRSAWAEAARIDRG